MTRASQMWCIHLTSTPNLHTSLLTEETVHGADEKNRIPAAPKYLAMCAQHLLRAWYHHSAQGEDKSVLRAFPLNRRPPCLLSNKADSYENSWKVGGRCLAHTFPACPALVPTDCGQRSSRHHKDPKEEAERSVLRGRPY